MTTLYAHPQLTFLIDYTYFENVEVEEMFEAYLC